MGQTDHTRKGVELHLITDIIRLWRLLDDHRGIYPFLTIAIIMLNAVVEVLALAAVVPFLTVLASPRDFENTAIGLHVTRLVGQLPPDRAVLWACTLFAVVTVLAAASRLLTLAATARFSLRFGTALNRTLLAKTLAQPYAEHARQNSASVIANITQNSGSVINGVVTSAINLTVQALTTLGVLATLIWVNWQVALSVLAVFGAAYAMVIHASKTAHVSNGSIAVSAQVAALRALQEGLGNIRDVIIGGSQAHYLGQFVNQDHTARRARNKISILTTAPKYLIETVGMLMICGIALVLSRGENQIVGAVPVLGALALGAQRLLPAMQGLYGSLSSILSNSRSMEHVLNVLTAPTDGVPHSRSRDSEQGLQSTLSLRGVSFRYAQAAPLAVADITFDIRRGQRVGIVGATGSGKSTLMDLILGLLEPTSGVISIDGADMVGERRRCWQRALAHVPQTIYLADTSIAENIALGLPKTAIDMARIRQAATLAQIADHIDGLAEGYDTVVGERGIRLSGGQRQRLGIARALYKGAQILVFDEATSALDEETERDLMAAIDGLSSEMTIIMIAHRLSTVRRCDLIIRLDKGRLVAQGSAELVLG